MKFEKIYFCEFCLPGRSYAVSVTKTGAFSRLILLILLILSKTILSFFLCGDQSRL